MHKKFFADNKSLTGAMYDVYQSKNGLLWLGTDNGLASFDGKYLNFYHSNLSAGKAVSNILETSGGIIWCQNFSGQYFFVRNDSLLIAPIISNTSVFNIATVIHDSIIAFYKNQQAHFYNTKRHSLKKVYCNEPFLQSVSNYKNGNELTLISGNSKSIISVNDNLKKSIIPFSINNSVFFSVKINNINYVISKMTPYQVENTQTHEIKNLSEIKNSVLINNVVIRKSQIVLLTTNGLFYYDKNFNFIKHLFKGVSISEICYDKQNNLWMSTLNSGLILICHEGIKSYFDNINFSCLTINENTIYAGTKKNEIYEIYIPKKSLSPLYKDLTQHEVRALLYNKKNEELAVSNQQLLFLKNRKTPNLVTSVNEIKQIDSLHYLISEGSNVSIYPISDTEIFNNWKNKKNSIYSCKKLALLNNIVRCTSADIIDTIILSASTSGLLKISPSTTEEILYQNIQVKALNVMKVNNCFYVSTINQGVLKYENNKLSLLISPKAFKSNEIYKTKIFNNKLYVVCHDGLYVFNLNGVKIKDYFLSDGFINTEIIDFVIKNDSLYASNSSGIIVIPLNDNYSNFSKPDIIINNTYVNTKRVNINELPSLNYGQYLFEINFSIIDFKGLDHTKAYYKINNGDWIETSNNKIILTSLEPNSYCLFLKAVTKRGEESNIKEIKFKINSPFYKTWWFVSGCFITIFLIVFFVFRYRIKNIQQKNKLLSEKIKIEKELHQSTLASIKSQMNPHFIFNALNTIQSYIYLNDKKAAGDYLVSFSELTRYILEMSNREKTPLSDEIKALNLYLKLEKMRFEEDFSYNINIDNITSDSTMIPSMLIQPYVENAVKHGLLHKKGLKNLQINFIHYKDSLTVEIIDNGIGIEASAKINAIRNKKHNSFASEANKKRLEILNSNAKDHIGIETITLKNEQQQTIGTKVIIKIPII